MQNGKKDSYLVPMLWTSLAANALLALVYIGLTHPVSPYQPLSAIQSQYKSCKTNSPPGFDCVMVPMMVSEQAMTELGAP